MKLPYAINWKYEWIALATILIAIAASPYFYQHFPEQVATHWNFQGQPDGYSGRAFAAFFFPALILGIYLLITLIPLIDPRKDRYKDFSRPYNNIRLSIVFFFVAVYALASLNGIGYNLPVQIIMPVGVGLLFIILGNIMPKMRRNWFVGIRTPWTLSSETVWNKSHRFGGKMFVLAGIIMILSTVMPPVWYAPLFFGSVVLISLGTIFYSWWVWKKES